MVLDTAADNDNASAAAAAASTAAATSSLPPSSSSAAGGLGSDTRIEGDAAELLDDAALFADDLDAPLFAPPLAIVAPPTPSRPAAVPPSSAAAAAATTTTDAATASASNASESAATEAEEKRNEGIVIEAPPVDDDMSGKVCKRVCVCVCVCVCGVLYVVCVCKSCCFSHSTFPPPTGGVVCAGALHAERAAAAQAAPDARVARAGGQRAADVVHDPAPELVRRARVRGQQRLPPGPVTSRRRALADAGKVPAAVCAAAGCAGAAAAADDALSPPFATATSQ